jgi:hypothetical protein
MLFSKQTKPFYYLILIIFIIFCDSCQNSLQCIADYRECDGIEDCEDKTDEDPNICGLLLMFLKVKNFNNVNVFFFLLFARS